MLQAVLIVSSSGLVLFSQAFTRAGQGVERMVGALLRTISTLGDQVAGALRYLEFDEACVYLTSPPDALGAVSASVFFDREASREVGLELGHAVAGRLLTAFVDDYGAELESALVGAHALSAFREFSYRIPAILREAARAQLQQIALLPLVDGAMLVTDEGSASESFNNPDAGPGRELDDVAVLATIRPLLSSAADLLTAVAGDALTSLSVATDPSADARVLVWRLDGGVLIVQGTAACGEAVVTGAPRAAFHVLRRLCTATSRLRRGGGGSLGGGGGGGAFVTSDAAGLGALVGGGGGGGMFGMGAGLGDLGAGGRGGLDLVGGGAGGGDDVL